MIYKVIPNYSNYSISLNGDVKNNNSNYYFKKNINSEGYVRIQITNDFGKSKTCAVHRLIALTYLPNFYNKKTVDHINNIKDDNRLINLKWASQTEQAFNKSKIKKKTNDNHDLKGEIWKTYYINAVYITVSNLGRIQMKYSKTYGNLIGGYYNVVYNKKTSGGFIWKYDT